eukprot:gene12663-9057_t
MLRADALNTAKRHNLDLVLVDKDASPPVCKLEDVIKMLRKDKDMEKKKKSAQKARVMKEILIKIGIDPHDLDIKMKRSRKFLMDGHPLKVIIFARRKAMYKTKRHVEKNAHLLNLPMMDIDEICSAVFSSLMDLPITVAKKDILTAEAQDNTGPPEKVHVPEIIDGHIRRELVFVPKLTVIERMKYEKIRKEKEAAKRE